MRDPTRSALWVALSAILAAHAAPLAAESLALHYVTNTQDAGAGSLRAAIAASNASPGVPDTIQFDPVLDGATILIESTLSVTDTLTIAGPDGGVSIRRGPGQPEFRLFMVDDGTPSKRPLRLERLVLEGGVAHALGNGAAVTARGGAIYSREGLELVACIVSGNQALAENSGSDAYADGGAVAVVGGPLYMVLTMIAENTTVAKVQSGVGTAMARGPILVDNQSSQPTIIADSIISGNTTTATATLEDARATGSNIFGTLSLGNGTDIFSNEVYATAPDYALAAGGGLASQTTFQNYSTNFADCNIRDNAVYAKATAGDALAEGGGLLLAHLVGGTSSIQRCSIANNSVQASASHIVDGAGTAAAVNATAEAVGGGLWLGLDNSGIAFVIDSTVSGNAVQADAAATHSEQAVGLDVEAAATAAARGSALFSTTTPGGTLLLFNSTVSGNSQEANAHSNASSTEEVVTTANSDARASGGVYLISGGALSNSTIADNHSIADGSATAMSGSGGPENESLIIQAGASGVRAMTNNSVLLYSNLIAQNTVLAPSGTTFAPDLQGVFVTPQRNLVSNPSGSNIVGGVDGNIVTPVAQLGPLADNGGPTHTHALLPGVVAIDAGVNPYGFNADQRGYLTREVNGAADIGAFELGAAAFQSDQIFADGFE